MPKVIDVKMNGNITYRNEMGVGEGTKSMVWAAGKWTITQTQWHSGKIAGLSAGRHGVQSSILGRGEQGFDSSINWGNHRKPSFLTLYCLSSNHWERLL